MSFNATGVQAGDGSTCFGTNPPTPRATESAISASVALAPRVVPTSVVVSRGGLVYKAFSGQSDVGYRILRARYFVQQHDLAKAVAEYRLAAAMPPDDGAQPSYHDLVTRVPLSVLLYRAGRIAEARSEWRTMLAGARTQQYPGPPEPASIELLVQRRLDLLTEREIPRGLPDYVENGAARYVVRGFIAVKQGRNDEAAAEWRCAVRVSPTFELPHLLLGYVAALRGDVHTAKREWIATLEGVEPGPGDMLSVTGWQYDAMEALLRYS